MTISALTVIEIVGRKLFAISLKGVDEWSGYGLAVVSAVGFSWALVNRSHMRVTLLLDKMPPVARSLMHVVAMLTLAGMAAFCAWRGFAELTANFESGRPSNTPMQTPIWMPQALWFAGLAMFSVLTAVAGLHAVGLFVTDRRRLDQAYGAQSLDEEIAAEVSLIEARRDHATESAR